MITRRHRDRLSAGRARLGGASCRALARNDSGATLVEFALTSLLFMTMAFGTLEFSRMIMNYNIVAVASREGVRYASVRGAASGRAASATDVKNYVVSRANGLLSTSNVAVTWPVNNSVGSEVQVQVSYSFVPIVGLLPQAAINLSSTTRMIIVK